MKKILSIALLCMLSISLHAQDNEAIKFLGIPVDGSKYEMIRKLKAKGFTYYYDSDYLSGEFNGEDVEIAILTNKNKVWRVAVCYSSHMDENQIIIRFNRLCEQFFQNKKYVALSGNWRDYLIPEDTNLYREIEINDNEFQAIYVLADAPYSNNVVWFSLNYLLGEYFIYIYYDNMNNQANGEDL